MGKRSSFERVERDFYPTPYSAVVPLLPHLDAGTSFFEPCAGDGRLAGYLTQAGHVCTLASDVEPRAASVVERCLFQLMPAEVSGLAITNPPWARELLHPMIDHLLAICGAAWLLFDADWPHTKQASPYMTHCRKIVSIGRVKWIEDSKHTGKDNCAWYFFSRQTGATEFFGRQPAAQLCLPSIFRP